MVDQGLHFKVTYLDEVDSTNKFLIDKIRMQSVSNAEVVWAGNQTAGRGRLERRWMAPTRSSLLASFSILTAEFFVPVRTGFVFSAAMAVAAKQSIEKLFNLDIKLKWPNDLIVPAKTARSLGYYTEHDLKLGGILTELGFSARDSKVTVDAEPYINWVVVGIGVNVLWPKTEELPNDVVQNLPDSFVSLNYLVDVGQDPIQSLLKTLIEEFENLLDGLDEDAFDEIFSRYESLLTTIGKTVKVIKLDGEEFVGQATGLTSNGGLIVVSENDQVVIFEGDVFHLR